MSLPSMDIVTGALLIGTWVSSLLYMAELFQAVYYFRHFKHDDWKLKTQVTVTFTIDTVSTFADCACVYLYTITHAGDPVYLATQHWPIALYIVTTAIVAVLVQSFLVERYWRFTKSIIITLFLGLLITAACGGALTCLVVVAFFPAFKDRGKLKIPGTIWLVNQAVADLSIAAALLWELRKVKSDFKETRSMLKRLAARTIQTGTVSATVAAIALTTYLLNNESNVTVGIGFCIGRVYVLTMLSNLNFRHSKPAPRVTLELSGSGFTEQSDIQFHHSDIVTERALGIPSEQLKSMTSSAKSHANDSSPAEIEITANCSSKQQSGFFAA
ncbi:hypothetical protein B0H14DRAFT_3445747 [Mycena olivaceomarginata]|nr:hypothetical protein B0H14DRAFT_3445747 [Mycena olivaceomarginata]